MRLPSISLLLASTNLACAQQSATEVTREIELLSGLVSHETPEEVEQEVDAVVAAYAQHR